MNLDDLEKLTKEDILALKEKFDTFQELFMEISERYQANQDLKKLEKKLYALARKYKKYGPAAMVYVHYGDDLIEKGENEAGILYLQIATEIFGEYADEITCLLRFAEYYIEKGEIEKGISYLIQLCCETTDNYEQSIEFRGLTQVWEKYKPYVEGEVPESLVSFTSKPLAPEECSMQIQDILNLQEDILLRELSIHLYEMSGSGESLNYLNKWERLVFYLDMLCVDINSDGIEHFVEYHGNHLKQTKKAMEELGLENGIQFLEQVQKKMKKHIEDFEDEESFYYKYVEHDLLAGLYQYVVQNKTKFR